MNTIIALIIIQKSLIYVSVTDSFYYINKMNLLKINEETLLVTTNDITALSACTTGLIAYRTNDGVIKFFDYRYNTQNMLNIKERADFPNLSLNGGLLAYSQENPSMRDDWDIMVYDMVKDTLIQITDAEFFDNTPSLSHTGQSIVFSRGGLKNAELFIFDVDNNILKLLLENNKFYDFEPAISPNGGKITFSSNRNGSFDIWVYDLLHGQLQQLTNDPGIEGKPIWLDDENIIYEANHPDNWGLWIMDIKIKSKGRLTPKGEKCRFPAIGY